MSNFYANLPNTSRSQFQFDKIYPNRMTMEMMAATDEVFVGRYVLVEYDSTIEKSYRIRAYRKDDDFQNYGYLYSTQNFSSSTIVRYTSSVDALIDPTRTYNISLGIYRGIVVYVQEEDSSLTFYQCVGQDGNYAVFSPVGVSQNYIYNYTQDKNWALSENINFGKGWDSTVWLKVFAEGRSKYIMVAELNTALPTFTVSADAPSISPVPPHFDERSNNQFYVLHQQPQWGIRVKSAYGNLQGPAINKNGEINSNLNVFLREGDSLNYPSDMKADWTKSEYNFETDSISNYVFSLPDTSTTHVGTWKDVSKINDNELASIKNQKFPAAIYFNKDGLDKVNIRKSSDLFDPQYRLSKFNYVSNKESWPNQKIDNVINFTPTGLSGHSYNQHNGRLDQTVKKDTYELSIMLPSLGDTISDIWDLIYGGRDIDSIKISNKRNTIIDWEDVSLGGEKRGLRLISSLGGGSQAYKVSEVNTLAGCINTAHDIMGMIIHDTTGQEIDLTDQNTLNDLSADYIYYYGNTYYRKRKFYDYIAPQSGESLKKYELVSVIPFLNDTYYKKISANYLLLNEVPKDDLTIYTRGTFGQEITFTDTYSANKFYYKVHAFPEAPVGSFDYNLYNYYLDTSPVQSADRDYVSLIKYDEDGEIIYEQDEFGRPNTVPLFQYLYFYQPGKYYYYADPQTTEPVLDNNNYTAEQLTEILRTRTYYFHKIETERNIVTEELIIRHVYGKIQPQNMVLFERGQYYRYDNGHSSYIVLTSEPEITNDMVDVGYPCYCLPYKDESVLFYQSNKYYYGIHIYPEAEETDPNYNIYNYILDTSLDYTPNRVYYTSIDMQPHQYNFYIPNKYYATNSSSTEPADNATLSTVYDSSKYYWKKLDSHVAADANGHYRIGAKWNLSEEDAQAAGVTLCNKTERWGIEELKDLNGSVNTLFGLLLRAKTLLDEGYEDTRELTSIQGCINILNDIINNFGKTAAGSIMVTNPYGQITGYEPYSNSWINFTLNNTNNRVNVTHKTITGVSGNYGDSSAQIPSFNDTFKVPYITVDGAGHITGISAHDVTIPQGSLSDTVANGADVITQLSFTASSGALSTTRTNIGNLKLTGYNIASSISSIASTDTINQAFGKLQKQINSLDFDPAGAAAAVVGTSTDVATDNTIYGVKAYADSLISEIPSCDEENDGTYVLKCTIINGEKNYEWIEET